MYEIAILQGRLSPDYDGRFQFFPSDWEREFAVASKLGFFGLEWLVDSLNWQNNPIFSGGMNEILELLPVTSVCADWFMDIAPWEQGLVHKQYMTRLIERASATRHKLVLVPLLEKHGIHNHGLWPSVHGLFRGLDVVLKKYGVRIGFETELAAADANLFVSGFESDAFGIYYDTGNATSYGFDCASDIHSLGSNIFGVHLKDRRRHSNQSVFLGKGDTDFKSVFTALGEIEWVGTPIMQAWRGVNYLTDAERQLDYIMETQGV